MIDAKKYGVSFSIKQCRNFEIDPKTTLKWLIEDMGFRRFRLMSYWNELEIKPGIYDFSELDSQIKAVEKVNGEITLCLGARQPRWPENHWPDWAWELPKEARTTALMEFVEVVVKRYQKNDIVVSWQLENEALLESFGQRSEVDRTRLRQEYEVVKKLDPKRPVIMTTSTSWGIPLRKPIPDIVGFSLYNIVFDKGAYHRSLYFPFVFRLRAAFIALIHRKPSFIHELQLEPWGPKAIWEMPISEQDKSMNTQQIEENLQIAKATKLKTIDLWGGEWWYWRAQNVDQAIADAVKNNLL